MLTSSCASGTATVGPLTLDVPDAWRAKRVTPDNLEVADGTTGGGTEGVAGDATAVFNVRIDSPLTPEGLREYLREQNTGAEEERLTIDGHEAVAMTYVEAGVRRDTVFIPAWRVEVQYRAAFGGDDAAFLRNHSRFRRAVESIRFEGRPPRPPT